LNRAFWSWGAIAAAHAGCRYSAFSSLAGPGPVVVDTGYRSNQIMETTLHVRGLQSHETMIESQLKKHGLRMGDVRYVLHTHLHIDHAGKDDLFPMNTAVVINRKELEFSVSGLMHPQYPAVDIKHLIDRFPRRVNSGMRFNTSKSPPWRGDAVRLGRQHMRNGIATLKTEKTDTEVSLPILPVLLKTLSAGPCGDLTFFAGEHGHPLTKESFGNLFRKACRAAGLHRRSAHGLRKAAATRAANEGATVAELEAIFGWQGGTMAALYTRAADRRRLAQGAMHKLGNGR
jgi:integrase